MAASATGRVTWSVLGLAVLCAASAGLAMLLAHEARLRLDKGYLAAEIQAVLAEVAQDKTRLRVWAYRALVAGQEAEPERARLLAGMAAGLARLRDLDEAATALQRRGGPADPEAATRAGMIAALEGALHGLGAETARLIRRDPRGASGPGGLERIDRDLDAAEGADLPSLMAAALGAEAAALQRERAAAELAMARLRIAASIAGVAAIPGALGLALWLAASLRRPLRRLEAGIAAFAAGTPGRRLGRFALREFDRLAAQFDAMADQIDRHAARERLREAEARAALEGQVAQRTAELEQALAALAAADLARTRLLADVGHGLRTPVTVIRGEAQVALRRPEHAEGLRDGLDRIVAVTRQMERLIEDLLVLAQAPEGPAGAPGLTLRIAAQDLAPVLAPSLALAQRHAAARGVAFAAQIAPGLRVLADAERLAQVLDCLLDNAIRYAHPGGCVRLTAARQGPAIRLAVQDDGIGIAPDEAAHLYDRGWRSAAARAHRPDGLGLGLAIARTLAQAQGARLTLASRHPDPGTEARLDWPPAP